MPTVCSNKGMASSVTVLVVLGTFALFANYVSSQGEPDSSGSPRLEDKLDELGDRAKDIEQKVNVLKGKADGMEAQLNRIQSLIEEHFQGEITIFVTSQP